MDKPIHTVVKDGVFDEGMKRAKLGAFCALEDGRIVYWGAKTGGVTRIQRNVGGAEDTRPFQTRYLEAGQDFEGYILLDDPSLAPAVAEVFGSTVWLGADRYEGFGKCTVSLLEQGERPAWRDACGYRDGEVPGEKLYLLAVSPFTMLDCKGDPCGLDTARLAEQLGVDRVEVRLCATSPVEFGGYNRTWQCRGPGVRMYDRGSLFQLHCSSAPTLERLRALEERGLGIRQAEGFGQILFLRPALLEGIALKAPLSSGSGQAAGPGAALRRARYNWIMDNSAAVRGFRLSKSQLGTVQSLCERALARDGDLTDLRGFFRKNLSERGAQHGRRFQAANEFLFRVLENPLYQTLQVESCPDSIPERLKLLIQLFNFSRKEAR